MRKKRKTVEKIILLGINPFAEKKKTMGARLSINFNQSGLSISLSVHLKTLASLDDHKVNLTECRAQHLKIMLCITILNYRRVLVHGELKRTSIQLNMIILY